jgi:pectinesterase
MPAQPHRSVSRRGFLAACAAAGAALGLAPGPAWAVARPGPFGRYGSPAARRDPRTCTSTPAAPVTSPPSGTP